MHTTFILGSGISLDAGMPSVKEISARVFSGEGIGRNSDGTYSTVAADQDHARHKAAKTISFVQELKGRTAVYYDEILKREGVSYEDVANLAKQIRDSISGEYENPALLALLRELTEEHGELEGVRTLATEVHHYICDIVWEMLAPAPRRVEHLRAITGGCAALSTADLFELNHDGVLEAALSEAGLEFSDGFGPIEGDLAVWRDCFDAPIRQFKLHGSLRWFSRTLPSEGHHRPVTTRTSTNDHEHALGPTGKLLGFTSEGRPQILAGTFDKSLSYDGSIFADQHFHFHGSLRSAEKVVVIGYGFRDKAINTRLINWVDGTDNRRLSIVHPNVEGLLDSARGAIQLHWERWIDQGKLRIVQKRIADTTWEELSEAIAGDRTNS